MGLLKWKLLSITSFGAVYFVVPKWFFLLSLSLNPTKVQQLFKIWKLLYNELYFLLCVAIENLNLI